MKLDLLVFAAHPDDAELACSGTIIKHVEMGKKVGIIDLTRGEIGTRGTAETRAEESAEASKIMGIHVRENLGLADGFFDLSKESQLAVIKMIRKYRPEVVLANAVSDRHPDHGRGSALVSESYFKAGLRKIETYEDGQLQEAWRPGAIYHYIQDRYIQPDFVIDITAQQEKKIQAIKAYKTQFFNPDSEEPGTYISSPQFIDSIVARAIEFGKLTRNGIYAEGYTVEKIIEVKDFSEAF